MLFADLAGAEVTADRSTFTYGRLLEAVCDTRLSNRSSLDR